jgi:quercetin dioxygenase-like cupin family protein
MRRVVTGHDSDGFSIVQIDGPAPEAGGVFTIWSSGSAPVDNATDTGELKRGLTEPSGVNFFSFTYAPNHKSKFHRSITADYGYVISGAVDLLLDNDKVVTLRAGDTFIQRGTVHGWSNPRSEPCKVIVVVVAATHEVGRKGDWPRTSKE